VTQAVRRITLRFVAVETSPPSELTPTVYTHLTGVPHSPSAQLREQLGNLSPCTISPLYFCALAAPVACCCCCCLFVCFPFVPIHQPPPPNVARSRVDRWSPPCNSTPNRSNARVHHGASSYRPSVGPRPSADHWNHASDCTDRSSAPSLQPARHGYPTINWGDVCHAHYFSPK